MLAPVPRFLNQPFRRFFSISTNVVLVQGLNTKQNKVLTAVASQYVGEGLMTVNFIKNNRGNLNGKAIFTYQSNDHAQGAITKHNGQKGLRFTSFEDDSLEESIDTEQSFQDRLKKRVVVYNLPDTMGKDELTQMLIGVCQPSAIEVPVMPNGQPKGYAMLYLNSTKEVDPTLNQLNGQEVDGHVLNATQDILKAAPEVEQTPKMARQLAMAQKKILGASLTSCNKDVQSLVETFAGSVMEEEDLTNVQASE